jgi:hypothetical protein
VPSVSSSTRIGKVTRLVNLGVTVKLDRRLSRAYYRGDNGIEAGETLDLSRRLRGLLQMMLMTRRNLVSGVAGLAATAALRGANARMPLGANVILPGSRISYGIYDEPHNRGAVCVGTLGHRRGCD